MSWIVTHSGREIDFENLEESEIELTDLIFALARINRFCGHSSVPYNVLDHSIECYYYACAFDFSPEARLACLCHDLHEGLIGDVSTPVKLMVPAFKDFEQYVEREVHVQLGIWKFMVENQAQVKQADLALLLAERDAYLTHTTPWAAEALVTQPYGYRPLAYREVGLDIFYGCLNELSDTLSLPYQFQIALDTYNTRLRVA